MDASIIASPQTTTYYRERIGELDQQIESLENTLSQMKDAKKASLDRLLRLALQKTPVETIPDDVLREIFAWTLSDATELSVSTKTSSITPDRPPMVLLHVCRRWKRVAQDHYALWSSLRILLTRRGNETDVSQQLKMWTEKAQLISLQLQIIVLKDDRNIKRKALLKSVPTLDLSRITKLTLCGIRVNDAHKLPSDIFPALEDLILRFSDADAFPWQGMGPVKAFSSSPRFRRVGLGALFPNTKVQLPWHQFSHIIIESPSPHRLYTECLADCPHLTHAFLPFDEPAVSDEPSSITAKQLLWPSISALSLNLWPLSNDDVQYPFVIDRVDLQHLKSLRLQASELDLQRSGSWNKKRRTHFLGRLKTMVSLEYLSLCFSETTKQTYQRIFKCVPQITTLDLAQYEGYLDVFLLLTSDASSSNRLLPNLKTIVVEFGDVQWWDFPPSQSEEATEAEDNGVGDPQPPSLFVAMIASRRTGPHDMQLERVVIYVSSQYQAQNEHYLNGLTDYQKGGLAVEIRVVSKEREREHANTWLERDPELQGWHELRELFTFPST